MILLPQKVAYRGTISSLRISSVDGTAFLDNCAALVPYADGNHRIEIYDSAGRQLVGYLSAQGSGETLDAEMLTGWTNHGTQGFDTFVTSGREVSSAIELTSGGRAYSEITFGAGKLYKVDITGYTLNSGVAPRFGAFQLATVTAGTGEYDKYFDTGPVDFYFTKVIAAYIGLRSVSDVTNFAIADTSVKQVTAPSTDGVTIVSTKGGATQNFAYKNTSFTYNAATNYVVVRKAR